MSISALAIPYRKRLRPGARLALKAEGGVLPLRWIVNGAPVGDRTCAGKRHGRLMGRALSACRSWMPKAQQTACWCALSKPQR